ncbi:hypothetical protein [Paenibacillus nuruki]|uniref:hypothetical protein n=1 Tax=Paenibacillus nuruki TaxID=1886670 RepID=UPI002804DD65|nr:hypothetical protein [Paenibacillus nuruki]CAJ1317141.1 hypothetical protein AASFL403_18110 [Paenibacillus nuruki]
MEINNRDLAIKAYKNAVYSELKRRLESSDRASNMMDTYYKPLKQTWGLELNPEALVEEMIRLDYIKTHSYDANIMIRPHFRTSRGKSSYIIGHRRLKNILKNAKVVIKEDPTTGTKNLHRN